MRSRKWLWLVQTSVSTAIWSFSWKDTAIHSSQNLIFCHFYNVKRHETEKASKGKSETSKSASQHFKYQINMVNSTLRHAGCHSKLILISGIISFNDLWIINEKSNSGIWAKWTKLLFQIKQTKKKIVQWLSNNIHPSAAQIPLEDLFLEDSELWALSVVSSWLDSSTRCKMKGQQSQINNR